MDSHRWSNREIKGGIGDFSGNGLANRTEIASTRVVAMQGSDFGKVSISLGFDITFRWATTILE